MRIILFIMTVFFLNAPAFSEEVTLVCKATNGVHVSPYDDFFLSVDAGKGSVRVNDHDYSASEIDFGREEISVTFSGNRYFGILVLNRHTLEYSALKTWKQAGRADVKWIGLCEKSTPKI